MAHILASLEKLEKSDLAITCPEIMKGLFQFRNETPYSLRQRSQFHVPPVRTVFSGTESIKFLGPKIWELN